VSRNGAPKAKDVYRKKQGEVRVQLDRIKMHFEVNGVRPDGKEPGWEDVQTLDVLLGILTNAAGFMKLYNWPTD
jgi:hypothetical protein